MARNRDSNAHFTRAQNANRVFLSNYTIETDENLALLQCIRCPRAYHLKCLSKDIHKFNKKFVLCATCNVLLMIYIYI